MDTYYAALKELMDDEGRYSNHYTDPGGETFWGISRVWHPTWHGWQILDKYEDVGLPDDIAIELDTDVKDFYRKQFWNRIQGATLAGISPKIATKLFNTVVNLGVHQGVSLLQDALNLLNINKKLYAELTVDGLLGNKTMKTLDLYLNTRPGTPDENERRLLNVYGILQGGFYVQLMRKNPEMEVFRGWFDRAMSV